MLMPPKTIFITSRILGFCWARATTFANKRYLSCWKRVSTFFLFCVGTMLWHKKQGGGNGHGGSRPGLNTHGVGQSWYTSAHSLYKTRSELVQYFGPAYEDPVWFKSLLLFDLVSLCSHLSSNIRMMNSSFMSLSTLAITWTWNSNRKRTGGCFTGRNYGSIANLWVAAWVSNPGISFNAKQSRYSIRKFL
jgi:hypothetical protein